LYKSYFGYEYLCSEVNKKLKTSFDEKDKDNKEKVKTIAQVSLLEFCFLSLY